MHRTERIRQTASGQLTWDEIQKLQNQGWRLIAPDCSTIIEDSSENEALLAMMELIIQDGPYSSVAEELNRRGYRTREGSKWTPVSVFEMLPRLIDAGPRILSSENWHRRKQEYNPRINPPVV
jgi:hypothetical protein